MKRANVRLWRKRTYRGVHCRQDFAGRGANHRKAKDAIVAVANKSFHKALSLIGRLRAEYRVHRQPSDACHDALAFRFAFTQPYMGERGISEHAIRNQPAMRGAISACQIITYDPKIVFRYVRELWAAGAFSHRPNVWRTRLQSILALQRHRRTQHCLVCPRNGCHARPIFELRYPRHSDGR
jgi:hypothetical protein